MATLVHAELFEDDGGSKEGGPEFLHLLDAALGRQQLDFPQVLGQLVFDVHLGWTTGFIFGHF